MATHKSASENRAPLSVSYREAARILGKSTETIKRYVRKGWLKAFRLRGQKRAIGIEYASIRNFSGGVHA